MFRHHDVTDDHEAISDAYLFENREKAVTAARSAQKWQSPITGTSDKVQVMRAVGTMQAAGHGKPYGIGSIATRPCQKRKDGAPTIRNGKRKSESQRPGHPSGATVSVATGAPVNPVADFALLLSTAAGGSGVLMDLYSVFECP
jgi:hypothetical protein